MEGLNVEEKEIHSALSHTSEKAPFLRRWFLLMNDSPVTTVLPDERAADEEDFGTYMYLRLGPRNLLVFGVCRPVLSHDACSSRGSVEMGRSRLALRHA